LDVLSVSECGSERGKHDVGRACTETDDRGWPVDEQFTDVIRRFLKLVDSHLFSGYIETMDDPAKGFLDISYCFLGSLLRGRICLFWSDQYHLVSGGKTPGDNRTSDTVSTESECRNESGHSCFIAFAIY
jgi:hypothetical protein